MRSILFKISNTFIRPLLFSLFLVSIFINIIGLQFQNFNGLTILSIGIISGLTNLTLYFLFNNINRYIMELCWVVFIICLFVFIVINFSLPETNWLIQMLINFKNIFTILLIFSGFIITYFSIKINKIDNRDRKSVV